MTTLHVKKLHPDATLPTRSTTHAAALDVSACLADERHVKFWSPGASQVVEIAGEAPSRDGVLTLAPGERALIPTGLSMTAGHGHCVKAYPRSSSIKTGLTLINAVGLIDADYAGEVMLTVINHSNATQTIRHGDRLAQIQVEPVLPVDVQECDELPAVESNRTGGFGSTGR